MMEENNEDVPKVPDTSPEGPSRRASDTIYLKVLVPSIAAGAIIGKNGEAIGQMQKETEAKIKLSKLNDFYPGTTERVCLIQGPLAGVRAMHNYIMERILEKPEISAPALTPSGHIALPQAAETPTLAAPGYTFWPLAAVCPTSTQPTSTNRLLWERHKQVKILVPNCTAGLVIGKQGSYVSEIKEATGAFIQISQKSKDVNLPERCITIAGEADQLRAAVDMVLTKIAEDPQSGTCPTISYSHAQGPVASAYPTGSPFAYTAPPPTPQTQTLLPSRHSAATTAIVRQKSEGGIPMTSAYYHNALQATYFAAAAAAAAAAADYQQRLAAAGYHQQQQHRGMEAAQSGEASGASSSLESAGGGGGFVSPLTPPSGEQEAPSFYTTPLIPASQMILQPPGAAAPFALLQPNAVATGGLYTSTTSLESPLDSSGFPLMGSSPPPHPPPAPSSGVNTFGGGGGGGVTATFFSPLRASSPLSTPISTPTVAWLRSRGFSEEAVAEITHAMSTLSAHGVLNIGAVAPPESIFLAPPPISHPPPPPQLASSAQVLQPSTNEDTETEPGEAVVSGGTHSAARVMTTRSLLDAMRSNTTFALNQLQTPLQQAQSAVSRDDHLALKPLLALSTAEGGGGPVTELDFVNPSVKENLLHFAAHQLAGDCVHMLVNAPYKWDPQRRSMLGATALDLAIRHHNAYLPVVWPLASASSDVYPGSPTKVTPTDLLLRPPSAPLSLFTIIGLFQERFEDADYMTTSIKLLYELIRCTPTMLVEGWTPPEAQRCPECLSVDDASEPICLKNYDGDFDLSSRYACWLWHRYHADCETSNHLSPPSLLDCCRVVIRRNIMRTLTMSDSTIDYAKALKSLNLPPHMLSFLSFRDVWPVVNPKHKFEFRRGRQQPGNLY